MNWNFPRERYTGLFSLELSDHIESGSLVGPPWTIFHTFINSTVIFGGFHYNRSDESFSSSPPFSRHIFRPCFTFHISHHPHPFVLFTIRNVRIHISISQRVRKKKETRRKSGLVSPRKKKPREQHTYLTRHEINDEYDMWERVLSPASFIHSSTPSTNFHAFSRRAPGWSWMDGLLMLVLPHQLISRIYPIYPCSIEHAKKRWRRVRERKRN